MRKIDRIVEDFIKLVIKTFGANSPKLVDYKKGDSTLWFRIDNKVVYVDIYDREDFYCSWEILLDDSGIEFITQGDENQINAQRVIEIMSDFFKI